MDRQKNKHRKRLKKLGLPGDGETQHPSIAQLADPYTIAPFNPDDQIIWHRGQDDYEFTEYESFSKK